MWTGLAGSVLVHGALVALLILSIAAPPRTLPPAYAVELVAAPPASVATPAPTTRSAPVTPAPPAAKPKPATTKAPSSTRRAPAARAANPVRPLPGETPSTGSDLANVDLKGKRFPYPEYLNNLVSEILRRWNRPTDIPLSAEVSFVILRDGTVKDIAVVTTSRSYSFDLEARGAIEQAAAAKAFGPLPAGYGADYLQVNFLFAPRRNP